MHRTKVSHWGNPEKALHLLLIRESGDLLESAPPSPLGGWDCAAEKRLRWSEGLPQFFYAVEGATT